MTLPTSPSAAPVARARARLAGDVLTFALTATLGAGLTLAWRAGTAAAPPPPDAAPAPAVAHGHGAQGGHAPDDHADPGPPPTVAPPASPAVGRSGASPAAQPAASDAPADPVARAEVLTDGTIDLHNPTCPVMGGKAKDEVFVDWKGLRVHFCCPGCDEDLLADPKGMLRRVGIPDVAAFKASVAAREAEAALALTAAGGTEDALSRAVVQDDGVIALWNAECPIMGGPPDDEVTLTWKGVTMRFCCEGCDRDFLWEPETFLPKLGISDVEAFKATVLARAGGER